MRRRTPHHAPHKRHPFFSEAGEERMLALAPAPVSPSARYNVIVPKGSSALARGYILQAGPFIPIRVHGRVGLRKTCSS